MIRKVVEASNPILRKKSAKIKKFDKKTRSLAKDLVDTLKSQKEPEGVGLAGPQIGKLFRIFAMVDKGKIRIVVNPKITKIEKETSKNKRVLEGCLSIPHYYGPVSRGKRVVIEYQDINGRKHKEEFKNFEAQIVQHEVDHLNGKLFTDIILSRKLPLYYVEGDEWEEVDFAKIK